MIHSPSSPHVALYFGILKLPIILEKSTIKPVMTKSKILSTTNAHMQLPTEKDLAKRVRERHTRQENSQDGRITSRIG